MAKDIKAAVSAAVLAGLVGAGLLGVEMAPGNRDPLPPAKRAAVEKLLALERKGRDGVPAAAKPDKPTAPAPSPEPDKTWGLMSTEIGPMPPLARGQTLENKWLGQVDGVFTVVYAGHESDNPQQGVLVIWHPEGDKPPEVWRTPKPIGSLRIDGVEGSVIKLMSGTGALTYDMSTGQFE